LGKHPLPVKNRLSFKDKELQLHPIKAISAAASNISRLLKATL